MTTIIMLLEEKHLPVPEDVTVHQIFGDEAIYWGDEGEGRYDPLRVTRGQSAVVEAPLEALAAWLKPFDGVWVTKNPLIGWSVVHVKEEA